MEELDGETRARWKSWMERPELDGGTRAGWKSWMERPELDGRAGWRDKSWMEGPMEGPELDIKLQRLTALSTPLSLTLGGRGASK